MLNLTQHPATSEQIDQGVVEPTALQKMQIKMQLNFGSVDDCTQEEFAKRSAALVAICKESGETAALIGGAPYLMGPLEKALLFSCISSFYSFSERVSVEKEVDGKVVKTAVFKHVGFVEGRRV